MARLLDSVGLVVIAMGCTHEDGKPVDSAMRIAGTLAKEEVTYGRLQTGEFEFVTSAGQPFVRFVTDTGLEAYLLGSTFTGDRPREQIPARGIVRRAPNAPWYCSSTASFEYPPRDQGGRGKARLSGFTRLRDCGKDGFTAEFDDRVDAVSGASVDSTAPFLAGAVLSGLPSPLTWTLSARFGDYYLALSRDSAAGGSGFIFVISREAENEGRIGVACIGTSSSDGMTRKLNGISEIVWCESSPIEEGELTLEP